MITSKKIISGVLFIGITATLLSFQLPDGWVKAGTKPGAYDMGIDKGAGRDSSNVATIKSNRGGRIHGYGALMQTNPPGTYLGHRVRMSGFVKTKNVKEKSGLWFRVEAENAKVPLTYDDMSNRPITGSTDWQKYEIVLDVANTASKIVYGALLVGNGQIWFDDLKFEIVDTTVPVTARVVDTSKPTNLNFEK